MFGFDSHPYSDNCQCALCSNARTGFKQSQKFQYLQPYLPKQSDMTFKYENTNDKEESEMNINVNLNLFLRILGATKDIINDDLKTLDFMFEVKRKLEEFDKSTKKIVSTENNIIIGEHVCI